MPERIRDNENTHIQAVGLNEWLNPFKHPVNKHRCFFYSLYESNIDLKMNQEMIIPFIVFLGKYDTSLPYKKIPGESFQPAHPNLGYVVTTEDFDPEKRFPKLERAIYSNVDEPEPSGWLKIKLDILDIRELLSTRWSQIGAVISKLVCVIQYEPTGLCFEAQIEKFDRLHPPAWYQFYPVDAGPLANHPIYGPGNTVTLPANREQLAKLKMKFVLR